MEYVQHKNEDLFKNNYEINDWSANSKILSTYTLFRIVFATHRFILKDIPLIGKISHIALVNVSLNYFRPYMVKQGVKFIKKYDKIVSTRLHPMILSTLLNKPVEFVDNSYGKISSYYNTWLSKSELTKPLK